MEQHILGTGDASLGTSAIGLGCMGLSQGYYGPPDDEKSLVLIDGALDAGVTLFDTSMSYGGGHNERLLGRALARRRDEAVVATKFGIVRDENGRRVDGKPEHVRGFCEASLQRLGTDVIDLYYLHRVDPEVPIGETVGAMAELVADGLVRRLGVSEVTPEQLAEACSVHPITAVQFEWSLLWREPERDVVPAARRLGVGLVPYSPLGRGFLGGALTEPDIAESQSRSVDPRLNGEHLAANTRQLEALRAAAAELGITVGQLALAWLLAQGPDVVPIPGTRSLDRVHENVAAAGVPLSDADLARLDELVPAEAWSGDRVSFAATQLARQS